MSQRNGDKARSAKEQQKKLLRRKRNLELRQSLENNSKEMTDVRVLEQEPVSAS